MSRGAFGALTTHTHTHSWFQAPSKHTHCSGNRIFHMYELDDDRTRWQMRKRQTHTTRARKQSRNATQKKKIAKWNNENLWSLMQMEIYSLIRCHHDIMQLYIIYLAHCRHTQHSQQSSRSQCEIAIRINHLCVGWQKGEFIIALQHTHAYLEFKFHLNQSK